jgi:hypothetical protein
MSIIVIRGDLREQLLAAKTETELRDENGNFLGRFVPPMPKIPDLDITEEELASLLAPDRKTYTTDEVLAYVKGLTP